MATTIYDELVERIQNLTPTDQLRLLEELAVIIRRRIDTAPHRSILELQGLGKEIWRGIDAQEYVDQERASWSG
jgi:hypothetical protein